MAEYFKMIWEQTRNLNFTIEKGWRTFRFHSFQEIIKAEMDFRNFVELERNGT